MHGGGGGVDCVGVHAGSAALPRLVAVCATSTARLRRSVRGSANRGLMPEGTTPLAFVHAPHRCSWWRRRVQLIPSSSSIPNPTIPRMLLLLLPGRLLVVLTSAPALLLLPGTTVLPLMLPRLMLSSTTKLPLLLLRLLLSPPNCHCYG